MIVVFSLGEEEYFCRKKTSKIKRIGDNEKAFVFNTNTNGLRRYKRNVDCTAKYFYRECKKLNIKCPTFNLKNKKKCKKGDYLEVNGRKFCNKNGPDFTTDKKKLFLRFVSDEKKTASGAKCLISCLDDTQTTATTSITTTTTSCGSLPLKGDKRCDDENNNEGCGWDGGDCCGNAVGIGNCLSCQCLDPTFYSELLNSNWQSEDLDHINSVTTDFMTKHNVVGSSLAIAKNGKLVYAKGFGVMDKNTNEPVQATSLFRIASISKPITSAAIMLMLEKNPALLTSKVFGQNGILGTEYGTQPYSDYVKQITVEQLLTHTAGMTMRKNGNDPMYNTEHLTDNHTKLIGWVLDSGTIVQPATEFAYSNFGYTVLGRVIEKLSGQNYESYVKEKILNPIGATGMKIGSGKWSEKSLYEVTYYDNNGETTHTYYPSRYFYNRRRADAQGGWISSSVDLARFLVHFDGSSSEPDLLSRSTYETMITPSSVYKYYAKGWSVNPGHNNIWHTGGLPGTGAYVINVADGTTAVFLMNSRYESNISPMWWKIYHGVKNWPTNLDLF